MSTLRSERPRITSSGRRCCRHPALWNRPELRLDQWHLLVPRIAEVDKPLAVDPLGHLLKNLNPAIVVVDQVVVRREDRRYLALGRQGRKWNYNAFTASALRFGMWLRPRVLRARSAPKTWIDNETGTRDQDQEREGRLVSDPAPLSTPASAVMMKTPSECRLELARSPSPAVHE